MSETPSYSPPASGPSGPRAGFWRRFAAALLDGILIGIVTGILRALFGTNEGNGLGTLLGLFYYTYFEGSSGQTPGKKALGIRVIDFSGGGSIGYGRAFIRYIGRIVSGIVLLLGYLWMLWDKEKQTWHDKFANSVVVPESAYPVEKWP
jgi:uncharacterized RDD family membrane protein YckC